MAEPSQKLYYVLDRFGRDPRRFRQAMRRWLWRYWRQEMDGLDILAFLCAPQGRVGGEYRPGPRYNTLLGSRSFLKAFYGRATQEDRPMNYSSRHFGTPWMNVQKVLRRPPGGPRDPIVPRWQYHAFHMERHGDILEHHAVAAGIDEIAESVRGGGNPVKMVSANGVPTEVPYRQGIWLPTNALLDRYRSLCNASLFNKRQEARLSPALLTA